MQKTPGSASAEESRSTPDRQFAPTPADVLSSQSNDNEAKAPSSLRQDRQCPHRNTHPTAAVVTSLHPRGPTDGDKSVDPQIAIAATVDGAERILEETGSGDLSYDSARLLVIDAGEATEAQDEIEAAFRAISLEDTPRIHSLQELGRTFMTQFEQTGSMRYLEAAMRVDVELVSLGDSVHPSDNTWPLVVLGMMSYQRFEQTQSLIELDKATLAFGKALRSLSRHDENYPFLLASFGVRVAKRFEYTGIKSDLDITIKLLNETIALQKDTPYRGACLMALCKLSTQRGCYTTSVNDLYSAVAFGEESIQAFADDDPLLQDAFASFSTALSLLCTYDPSQIFRAVEVAQRALSLISDVSPYRPWLMSWLSETLIQKFEKFGSGIDDLKLAVELGEEALKLTSEPSQRYLPLINLSHALNIRFRKTKSMDDLETGFKWAKEAVDLIPKSNDLRPSALVVLGKVHESRFELMDTLNDLNESIALFKEAADVTRVSKEIPLTNLGRVLVTRFERTGSVTDLNAAIDASAQAVDAIPENDSNRCILIGNLSRATFRRFELIGSSDDLDMAVQLAERSVNLISPGSVFRPIALSNLSIMLLSRSSRSKTKSLHDLDDSIKWGEQAIKGISKDDPLHQLVVNHFSSALLRRFLSKGLEGDLLQAITYLQGLTDLSISNESAQTYCNLVIAFLAIYKHTRAPDFSDASINAAKKAVELTKDDDPGKAGHLDHLGVAFVTRFELTGSLKDFQAAVESFERSAQMALARPGIRLSSAISAAHLLHSQGQIKDASRMLAYAVHLMPSMSQRTLERTDQQMRLSDVKIRGLAADACALAVRVGGDISESLNLLELGRGILATIHLETRGDITRLRDTYPDFADKYKRLCDELNADNLKTASSPDSQDSSGLRLQLLRRHDLSREFDDILSTIRAKHGFERFLLGPSREELNIIAANGPIVILNASRFGSHALLVTQNDIKHLPLQNLEYPDLEKKTKMFLDLLDKCKLANYLETNQAITSVLEWLWDAAVEPVLNALGFTETPQDDTEWPRLWWVPIGLLSLFPIHAAGRYPKGRECKQETALDRVISSYTPTLKALDHARHQVKAIKGNKAAQTILMVSMSTTPSLKSLKFVDREIKNIKDCLPCAITRIALPQPTKAEVPQSLTVCSIAHFACHGLIDPDPSKSRILLTDWQTDPFTVAKISKKTPKHAAFAYISACHAASSREIGLLDESINIAAAFQLAGFPSVIGTLWKIQDEETAEVSKIVYRTMLTEDGRIDLEKGASALHFAVRQLRANKSKESRYTTFDPVAWAAYIHTGV